jgi:AcrR family transcriptional regulator
VVDGAMGLFATMPVDEVTVQDIASAVEMTSAAVYYHFASKEQILVEGMHRFSEAMLGQVRASMPADGDANGVRALVTHLVSWAGRHRTEATVYFVSSIGLNLMVEAVRRETRLELIDLLRVAVRASRGATSKAETGVIAVALVSLVETSLASMLNQDAAFRSLGHRRFGHEVGRLADVIVGIERAG